MIALTLQNLSKVLTDNSINTLPKDRILYSKLFAGFWLLFNDVFCLSITFSAVILLKHYLSPEGLVLSNYLALLPFMVALFPVAFYFSGLYPGYGLTVIDEIKSLTYSISFVFIVLASMTFMLKGEWEYSRTVFFLSWGAILLVLPISRRIMKGLLSDKELWGIPVMIIGAGEAGEKAIRSLKKQKFLGLMPVVAVDDDSDRWGYIDRVPVIGGLQIIPQLAKKLCVEHCMIALPEKDQEEQLKIINSYSGYFSNSTVISDDFGLSYLWVTTKDIGSVFGIELQQKLLQKVICMKKRIFDVVFGLILGIVTLPLLLFVALLIKFDSPGKVFFLQERLTIGRKKFRIFKFRTMYEDSDERLRDVLRMDESKRMEWEKYHKLRDDPRLTRAGKFLRKFSLDEIPQFWNVVRGDMSLIGPRAYLQSEYDEMPDENMLIFKVRPGLSGLWQITGRSRHSFVNRQNIDIFYIRNWSFFLDIYIFFRTVSAVYYPDGAY